MVRSAVGNRLPQIAADLVRRPGHKSVPIGFHLPHLAY